MREQTLMRNARTRDARHRQWVGGLTILLLLLMFARELHSARRASYTYDESYYLSRGYTYLKTGDTRLKLRHPILIDTLAALPVLLEPDIQLPLDDPGWIEGDFHRYADAFMWRANALVADRIVFLSRLPIMALSIVMAAGVFRWAWMRYDLSAGLLAMGLYTFDPNILAHSRLVTPDIGQTTFIFLAALAWQRYLKTPHWKNWLLAGCVLGLAQAAGFPALILLPVFAIASAIRGWAVDGWRGFLRLEGALLGAGIVCAFVVWGVYSFGFGPVTGLGWRLPAPYHWEEFLDLLKRLNRRDLAYFLGEVYRGGKPLFFMVVLLLKTPLPTLLLTLCGVVALLWHRRVYMRDIVLWLLPLLYYGNALRTQLNIGYRHILPILPFLCVIAGQTVLLCTLRWRKLACAGLGIWSIVASLSIHPFYLAYFNELAGGPLNGSKYVVVSDLDWGQDLPGLRDYLQARAIDEVYMSWFGTTPPEHYAIHYKPLPAWPPPDYPMRTYFHPQYPLPGVYAISAANLVGARLEDPATFAWFRQRPYEAHIGYSIFLYRVPRLLNQDAEPVNIALADVPLAALPVTTIETYFQTNAMRPRWFDARHALVFPAGRAFMALKADGLAPIFAERFVLKENLIGAWQDAWGKQNELYHWEQTAALWPAAQREAHTTVFVSPILIPAPETVATVTLPIHFGETLSLFGYEWADGQSQEDGARILLSYWRVREPLDAPLAIFVHTLGADGSILGQDDRLDVASASLYPGDGIVQLHRLYLSETQSEKALWVQIGVYRQDTMARFPVLKENSADVLGDRALLEGFPRSSHR